MNVIHKNVIIIIKCIITLYILYYTFIKNHCMFIKLKRSQSKLLEVRIVVFEEERSDNVRKKVKKV